MSKALDIDKVKLLQHGEKCHVSWFEDGGGEVYRIWDTLLLFSIPQYGGIGRLEQSFDLRNAEDLVELAFTWT